MTFDGDTTPRVIDANGNLQTVLRVLVIVAKKTCPECNEKHVPPFATHAYYLADKHGIVHTDVGLVCNGCNEWTLYL